MKEVYVFNNYEMVNSLIDMGYRVIHVRPNYNNTGMVYIFDESAKAALQALIDERKSKIQD